MHTRGKKLGLTLVSLVLSAIVLETGAAVVYWRVHGKPFSRAEIVRRLFDRTPNRVVGVSKPGEQVPGHVTNKLLHPYLGFVLAPHDPRINEFGFYGDGPLVKRSPDTVNVAIMGGSVALIFSGEGSQPFVKALRQIPSLKGRRVVLIPLAIDGYKQPQQLIALTWLLSLGSEFDILVNLDGFNEVALPFTDNVPAGVSISFPRAWNLYVSQSFKPETALEVAAIVRLRSQRAFLQRLFGRFPWRYSVFCLTLWDQLDQRWNASLTAEDLKLRRMLQSSNADPSVLGPVEPGLKEEGIFRESVQVWRDSSLQMAKLCRANGIAYFHFLQPNQYVAGSKQISGEEKRTAYSEGLPFRTAVERAYPLLRAEGAELRREGVAFFDLTQVFKPERETIYIDDCCHVNQRGNWILAREIARGIAERLGAEGTSR